nr:hypothetical protein [Stigmatella aurantiaca]
MLPPARRLLSDGDGAMLDEGVPQRAHRGAGRTAQFLVAAAQQREGILVIPEPDVKAMLLDAAMRLPVADARPLAAEQPPVLVDGDLIAFAKCRGVGEREGG